jgi:hypothetical protein
LSIIIVVEEAQAKEGSNALRRQKIKILISKILHDKYITKASK